jgi:prepilin-type N-terminal cleavage/methylation domain-containing protein
MLRSSLARLRHDDRGFTLVELLTAMVIGGIVLTAALNVFLNGLQHSYRTTDRVEATQRARRAMDQVVTMLNSQMCLLSNSGDTTPPIVSGDPSQVTFIANLGSVSADPRQYRIRYDQGTQTLWQDTWVGSRNAGGDLVFAASPTSSRAIAAQIVPAGAGVPIFTYRDFVTTGANVGTIDMATPLTTPLSTTDRFNAVRVDVAFAAQPDRTKKFDARTTSVQGGATVGSANADEPSMGVNC